MTSDVCEVPADACKGKFAILSTVLLIQSVTTESAFASPTSAYRIHLNFCIQLTKLWPPTDCFRSMNSNLLLISGLQKFDSFMDDHF